MNVTRASLVMATVAFVTAVGGAVSVHGQDAGAKTVWDGVFTAAQQQRGAKLYMDQCASCHGAEMKAGPGAPSLAGPEFQFGWDKKTIGSLADYVRSNMPPSQSGSLKEQEAADVIAAILKANGFPESATAELPPAKADLDKITLLASKP